jgi:hypothetical protein
MLYHTFTVVVAGLAFLFNKGGTDLVSLPH